MENLKKINKKYLKLIKNPTNSLSKEIQSLSYLLNFVFYEELKIFFKDEDWSEIEELLRSRDNFQEKIQFDDKGEKVLYKGKVLELLDIRILADSIKEESYKSNLEKNLWHLFFSYEANYLSLLLFYQNLK